MGAARVIRLGNIPIGGGHRIPIQTMTKTDTRDTAATVDQIRAVAAAGCDIVRVAVPDADAAAALPTIVQGSGIPVVADIHFDYRLALAAVSAGVHGLRINPGNIGGEQRVRDVAAAAADAGVPIRIGVNAGSLEKELLARYGGATPEAMVESAARHIALLEKTGFHAIKVSLKASDVARTVAACRLFDQRFDYPQHIGVTEAGTAGIGRVKSIIGIGALLVDGIGDTIRVSLTDDPLQEVRAGREILQALDLLPDTPKFVSCPTCGRLDFPIRELAPQIEAAVSALKGNLTVAVMGCAVNGPGEAKEANLGIVGGEPNLLYLGGKPDHKVTNDQLVDELERAVRAEIERRQEKKQ